MGPPRRHGPVPRRRRAAAPARAGRPARRRRRARRPDRAGRGVDGVVRGAGPRRTVRARSQIAQRRCPDAVLPARRLPGLRGGVRAGDGRRCKDAPRRGGRGAGLGRGLRRRRDRRPRRPRRAASRPRCSRRPTLHCSVGIGDTLVRAKIATDFGKPQGTFQLTRDNWMDVMGAAPDDRAVGRGHQDRRPVGGDRHPHRRGPGRRRRGGAGRGVRPVQRRPPRPTRARRRRAPGPTTPRGWPGRTGGRRPTRPTSPRPTRCEPRWPTSPRGRRRRAEGGPGGAARAPQGPLRAVLHVHQGPQAQRADVRHRRDRADGVRPLPRARRPATGAAARRPRARWCRRRAATDPQQ